MDNTSASIGENFEDVNSQIGSTNLEIPVDENELVVLRKRSKVWLDYKFYKRVIPGGTELRARCKLCGISTYPATGTGNPKKHAETCKGLLARKGDLHSVEFDQKTYCEYFARAIICHAYPLRIVEDEYFRKLHTYLNPNVKHVSRNTMLKYCILEHENIKSELMKSFEDIPGKISFTCDLWTACTNRGYLTLTAHYVDKNWILRSKILNFRHFEPPHRACEIKNFVFSLISEWKLQGKAQSMTLDNARYMDNMVDLLKTDLNSVSLLPCGGKFFHIRCCAHVLHLIVQAGLKCADACVSRLRDIVKYIDGSDSRISSFEQAVAEVGSDFKNKLILDVATRWNSTYLMLSRAIEAKDPINLFVFRYLNVVDRLSEEEWETIVAICEFLEPFNSITTSFSGSEYPTANEYFLNIILIEENLMCGHSNPKLNEMANTMYKKFESYWDSYSEILSVAVVLDPRCKLQFVDTMYRRLYVDSACQLKVNKVKLALQELYDYYASLPSTATNSSLGDSSIPPTTSVISSSRPYKRANILQNFQASSAVMRTSQSEIERYLTSALEPELENKDYDVLKYWQNQLGRFPVLAVMARDILSIPIASVASESAFSMGARTLNKYRSALLPKNVEVLVTTQNWLHGYDELEVSVLEIGSELENESS